MVSTEVLTKEPEPPMSGTEILTVGLNMAVVQPLGAYLMRARLSGQEVFFSGPGPNKQHASHLMSQKAHGDQHGPSRGLSFAVRSNQSHGDRAAMSFIAEAPDDNLGFRREFALTSGVEHGDTLTVTSTITNKGTEAVRQRIGEHFYFQGPADGDISTFRVDDASGAPGPGAAELRQVADGKPYFWDGFSGDAMLYFPQGLAIRMMVETTIDGGEPTYLNPAMMIWRRPAPAGEAPYPFLAAEPLGGGYDERGTDVDDGGFLLLPGQAVAMKTTVIVPPTQP